MLSMPAGVVNRFISGWSYIHEAVFVALGLAVFTWGALSMWNWMLDDAYISLRYAQHLARHGILSFNLHHPETPPTEGFSSPLWVVLLAALIHTGAKAVSLIKALSLLGAYAAMLFAALVMWKRLKCSAAVITALMATSYTFVYYSTSGMEMTWAWALMLAWLYWYSAPEPAPLSSRALSAVSLGLLVLIRPEGIILWAVAVMDKFFSGLREKNLNKAFINDWFMLTFPLLCWAGYEIFRLSYFGLPFPNTYYAKWLSRSPELSEKMPTNVYHSLQYTLTFLGALWPAVLLAEAVARPDPENSGWRRLRRPLLLCATVGWVFLWFVVSDNLPFYRFQMYSVIPFLFGGAFLVSEAIRKATDARIRTGLLLIALIAISGHAAASRNIASREWRKVGKVGPSWHQSTRHEKFGKRLKSIFKAKDMLLYEEMGAVPYFSGLDFIDFMGLNDRKIANIIYRHRQDNTGWAYPPVKLAKEAISRQPQGVLLRAKRKMFDPGLKKWMKNKAQIHEVWFTLMSMPGFRACYEYVEPFRINKTYYVYIYRKKPGCNPLHDGGDVPYPRAMEEIEKDRERD